MLRSRPDGEFSEKGPSMMAVEAENDSPSKLDRHGKNSFWSRLTTDEIKRRDNRSVALLLLLYTLQGVPMGLSASVPYLLQEKTSDYNQQALFSFVAYPFSLKLLWAPIVDGLYSTKFGRRKSWLVPTQLMIAAVLLSSAAYVDGLLDRAEPDVMSLTLLFIVLYTLCATQDIAVDGWALTMLSPGRVDLASICNTIGQNIGYFTSFILFLILSDAESCNKYIRFEPSDQPMVTLGSFMTFFGWIFLLTTIGVWVLKRELIQRSSEDTNLTVKETYIRLWQVCKLPAIQSLAFVVLTSRLGVAGVESVTALKLQEYGVPKEDLAGLGPLMFPVGLILPTLMGYMKMQPMRLWLRLYPYRVAMALPFVALVYYAQVYILPRENGITWMEYAAIFGATLLSVCTSTIMFTAQMQFYCKLSDPILGGTYLTLLNTLTNLGSIWPSTVALKLVAWFETCQEGTHGETCIKSSNGYYPVALMTVMMGVFWYATQHTRVTRLEAMSPDSWRPN
eukprot:m.94789 g.94789  ORF g.94789 m.94789 type:complete len:507 (-) comp15004_c0_seq2:111-1631(-)